MNTVIKQHAHAHSHAHTKTPRQWIRSCFRFGGRLWEYPRELGLKVGLQWYGARILGRFPVRLASEIVIQPPEVVYPVAVGLNPVSDEYVFDQIFVRHDYAPIADRLKDPKFILDLGANVGYASAFLASRYPAAGILAVEPDPRNFEFCRRTLKPYGDRIRVLQGAVWSQCARLALSHVLGKGMATQVVAAARESDANVEGWDISTLLDLAGVETADLVKIDIEGGEAELFTQDAGRWLSRVHNICIELHDQYCREVFFAALAGFDYELVEIGESAIVLNLRSHVATSTNFSPRYRI